MPRVGRGPRTPSEQAVAGIWSDVLRVPQFGVHDSFFEQGGHSLLATQVVSRIRDLTAIELPLPTSSRRRRSRRWPREIDEARAATWRRARRQRADRPHANPGFSRFRSLRAAAAVVPAASSTRRAPRTTSRPGSTSAARCGATCCSAVSTKSSCVTSRCARRSSPRTAARSR